jgi:O-succinylhomoserine sulfhydrylase
LGGAVLAFDVRSKDANDANDASDAVEARKQAFHVIDSTRVCSITANLGDTKTTITHPASTSHGRLSETQRQAAGIGQGLIRVAVGLEHIDDLKADLARGLDTVT